jgi:hypothetical protein
MNGTTSQPATHTTRPSLTRGGVEYFDFSCQPSNSTLDASRPPHIRNPRAACALPSTRAASARPMGLDMSIKGKGRSHGWRRRKSSPEPRAALPQRAQMQQQQLPQHWQQATSARENLAAEAKQAALAAVETTTSAAAATAAP